MNRPKLLLADDSVTIRKVVELTFADEGVDVTSAGDAQSAMHKFVEIQPDIVLVDVGLAGTSGYQICEMIKGDEATKHIPVLLLVGAFEPFDADEAHRVGADGFMTKPFNSIRDLVNRVSMLLSRRESDGLADEVAALNVSEEGVPETQDIDELYQTSLSETPETEKLEELMPPSELFGDEGLDDEMIEASYLFPQEPQQISESESETPVKSFDWSPEAIVEPTEGDQATCSEKELDPLEWEEPALAGGNESIATSQEMEPPVAGQEDVSTYETIEFSNSPAVVPMPVLPNDVNGDDELLDIFEEKNRVKEDPAIHETVPYVKGEHPQELFVETPENQISEELINEVVRRVVHKLSDIVVRDIAKVEVPRIAEKLIREALEQEGKG